MSAIILWGGDLHFFPRSVSTAQCRIFSAIWTTTVSYKSLATVMGSKMRFTLVNAASLIIKNQKKDKILKHFLRVKFFMSRDSINNVVRSFNDQVIVFFTSSEYF